MSSPDEYKEPLERAIKEMRDQMARPENVAKSSWLESTPRSLTANLDHHLARLVDAVVIGDDGEAARRAANVANFAWMLADYAAHHQAER